MPRAITAALTGLALVLAALPASDAAHSTVAPSSPGVGFVDDTQPGYGASMATLPDGTTLAVWRSGAWPNLYLKYSVHRPGRATWATPKTVPQSAMHGSSELDMSLTPSGSAMLTWVGGFDDASNQIRVATFTPRRRWTDVRTLGSAPGFSKVDLDVDADGGITVAARRTGTSEKVIWTRYTPGVGRAWKSARTVPVSDGHNPQLVTDSRGRQMVAFEMWDGIAPDSDDRRAVVATRSGPTKAWGSPRYLSPFGTSVSSVGITEAGGGVMAAWREYPTAHLVVRERRAKKSKWQAPQVLAPAGADVLLDSDARGRVTLIHESGLPSDPLMARRWNGHWSEAQEIAINVGGYRTSLDVNAAGRAAVLFRTDDDQNWVSYRKGTKFRAPKPLAPSSSGQTQADAVEVDAAGNAVYLWNSAAESAMLYSIYDYGPPRTKIKALKLRGRQLKVRWKAKDVWSDTSLRILQRRQAKPNGRMGPWRTWRRGGSSTKASTRVNPHRRQCVRVRSKDSLGNQEKAWRTKCIRGRR